MLDHSVRADAANPGSSLTESPKVSRRERVFPDPTELSEVPLPKRPLVRDRLREETAEVHKELEAGTRLNQAIAQLPRTQAPELIQAVGREQYRGLYHSFLLVALVLERGFEDRLEENSAVAVSLREMNLPLETPRGSLLIEQDLQALGIAVPDRAVRCARLPAVNSRADAIGLHYVRMGSRLGGTMIAKCVELNLGAETPREFLTRYGAGVRQVVETNFAQYEQLSPDEIPDAVRTAKETFAGILAWQQEVERELLPRSSVQEKVGSAEKEPSSGGPVQAFLRWLRR